MAQTTTVSTKELKRQAALAFEGKTAKVMLCNMTSTEYTAESTVTDWETIEVVGNGYVRFSAVIGTGSYSSTLNCYALPELAASFTATAPYSYNRLVIFLNGELYPHSVLAEDPNILISAGQIQTYVIQFRQDD